MPEVSSPAAPTPVAAARLRAARAKLALAGVGAAAFVVALALARTSHASHHKQPARSLAAPQSFLDTVRRDLLRGGQVAPPAAPPQAQTSTS